MESRNIRTVAIVSGGSAGWMSAAFLANTLGASVMITLIDLGNDTACADLNASIPPLKAYHQALGINEAEFIASTQGSMKLGSQFVNWGALGDRYFHPHGNYGAEFDLVALHQWWLKAKSDDSSLPDLEEFSMAWAMAREGRFSPPVPDRRMIQSTYDYAYHLDGKAYAEYLAKYGQARGVIRIDAKIKATTTDPQTGFLTELLLNNGQSIAADLYLDCSGQDAILGQSVMQAGFESWGHYLPCNKVISLDCERGGEFSPFTRITAREAGWQWRIPLQHKTSTGYVFASDLLSEDDAINTIMDNLDGRALGDPSSHSFVNGKSRQPFVKNVVAIGDAAGFLEPLEATTLHFIQSGLNRLLALWPTRACDPKIAQAYNETTASEWELARDLLILHYKATSRADAPLWRTTSDMDIPDSLKVRLHHWHSFGRLISPKPELFQAASWLSVLMGQGMTPKAWDPLADARADMVDYHAKLTGLHRIISETASQMPLHKDWIDRHARGAKT